MGLAQVGITATATMLAVLIGGFLTVRAQDRLWRRDQQRQWRDIRLKAYTDFISAVREYVAYILNPAARITVVPRPREPGDLMPFFDDEGSRYRERLETTKTSLRLVAGQPEVVKLSSMLVRQARMLAAARASCGIDSLPEIRFIELWAAEREFIAAARAEIGLAGSLRPRPVTDRG